VAAFVSWTWVLAQEPLYILKVDVPYVSVDVSVRDLAGRTVTDLTQEDFEIYEDGIRQEIRNFSPVATAYNVLLLFDRSGSTQHKWAFMQRAVASFIASLRPQDRIAIGAFDSEFQMQLEWTGDRAKAVLALPELIRARAVGGTNLYGALDRVLRREFRKVTGRRTIVVLTDGRDTSLYRDLVTRNRQLEPPEDRGFQKTLKTVRNQQIPLYFVGINTDRNLEPNLLGGDEYRNLQIIFRNSLVPQRYLQQTRIRMEQLAEASGGRILFPARIDEISPLYEQIARELGMSYSLGYISSNSTANDSFRQIQVRARNDKLRLTQSRNGYKAR
jgi:VWFA-related protein